MLPVLEFPQRAGLARHQRHRLRGIEGASAAESDHPVMTAVVPGLYAFGHVRLHGIPPHVGEDLAGEAGVAARLRRVGHHRHRRQPRVGDQKRAFEPEFAAGLRELADASGAEADRSGIVPVAGQGVRIDRRGHERILVRTHCRPASRARILSQELTFPEAGGGYVATRRRCAGPC